MSSVRDEDTALSASGQWRISSSDLGARILAVASHDLRNLLSNLVLNLDILNRSTLLQAGKHEQVALQRARRSTIQMRSIVENLQQLVAIEGASISLDLADHDVRELLEDAVETQMVLASSRQLQLTCHAPDEPCTVRADRQRVLQVITNLISNAIKFTLPRGEIRVSACSVDGGVRFTVIDSGIGIPTADSARVFERFWQGAASFGGVGLGLSIARSLIEAHGGRIWLKSEVGAGTEVSFWLPATPT